MPPILLYTDFGAADIYVGQVKSVLQSALPGCVIIDLINDVPNFDIAAAAHLLAALATRLPAGSVTIAVVDPGVGSARGAVALHADGRWYTGPDNGLLSVLAARARATECFGIRSGEGEVSVSFHGRDVFAPAAAAIAAGRRDLLVPKARLDVVIETSDLPRVIYIDHYGNVMTGLTAAHVDRACAFRVARREIRYARVFSEVPRGALFWYENSIGLVEFALNQGSAAAVLGIAVGDAVAFTSADPRASQPTSDCPHEQR